ncbi:MAG TPA: UvrD-helicase domain-containing protein [bacterium]|nr:UvrD-helicase domain-containing protein [bacterium]
MTARMLPDAKARRRVRTELDQTFIVEAGAGTGKTHLLVDRIEALVESGKARLRDIVAITFTEKAAAELRIRIRQRIQSHLEAASSHAADRFRTALEDLEIAPVSTIHAFAADLLRERPVEAGVDPAFTVADELTASLLRTQAWDRWLERQKDNEHGALREVIEFGISLKPLRALADAVLRYRDVVSEALDRGPVPQDPIPWLASAEPKIRSCIARIGTDCLDHADKAVAQLERLGQRLDVLARLGPAEVRRGILSGLKLTVGGNQQNWARGALVEVRRRLEPLQDKLEELQAAHAHYLAAGAVNWLRGYVVEYQTLKAREGLLDFDDLLLIARDLLRARSDVRAYFQKRFDAILVDEFQDTDPLQAEIVFFLAEDGPRARSWDQVRLRPGKLFIVGDPKQSIYAFRRADIETYQRAKAVLMNSGVLLYVTTNFRSVEPILTAVNETFQGRMRSPDDGAYQPEYVALHPAPATKSFDDSSTLTLLYPGPPAGEDVDAATLRQREAEVLAAFLRHSIEGQTWRVAGDRRASRYGDVAMLFRGMSDVPIYEEALKRYGVPYRVTSSRTFYKREEVGWLLNVLHAVEHPTDPVAVWGALRSPIFGCSDREIYDFVVGQGGALDYRSPSVQSPESVKAAYAALRELHEARLQLSVPQTVEMVIARTQALPTFLLMPQGEQRAANLTKVVTLARALEESGILTFRAFVHWLKDMEEQAVDEAESPTVEEGDNVVRIMSIHAAKGLEFPIVVIPDLGRGPGGGAEHLLVQHTGSVYAALVGKVEEWPIRTCEYETLKVHHANREAAERLRVLYVAMTRAKNALVLPVFPKPGKGSIQEDLCLLIPAVPKFGRADNGWLLVDGEQIPKVPTDPPPIRLSLADGPTPEGEAVARARQAWLHAREVTVGAAGTADPVRNPSGLADHKALKALQRKGASLESEPGGRALGTLVHAVLANLPASRADLVEGFVRYFADQQDLGASIRRRAVELVQAALAMDTVRATVSGRLWREVPFAKSDPKGTIEGAIDMILEDTGGVTVLDFKTDATGTADTKALEAVYSTQLKEYVDVVAHAGSKKANGKLIFLCDIGGRHVSK